VSPLEAEIQARIDRHGPMPLAEYMALCLGHPGHGYYATRDPLGGGGDFVTAPEVSQLFGEMLGGWIAQVWLDLGRPQATLAELGPGRGTLMADALRVARRLPGFLDRVRLVLVETSSTLREKQAESLAPYGPRWVEAVERLPEGPLLVVANEFFDALPIEQALRLDQGWQSRVVEIRDGALAFSWGPLGVRADLDARFPGQPEGTIVEVSLAGEEVAREVGGRIGAAGGAALIVDYGGWDGVGDTLQAVEGHRFANPLERPGEVDLTAHVRFRALAEASRLRRWGPVGQGVFLERLGITERARALAERAGPGQAAAVAAGHRRLTHPEEMGHLFQVMCLAHPRAPAPPGFDG
jgi:NADH dehydrogenase [ubiquinone] 1 alpha subcomplex assembly factor 7